VGAPSSSAGRSIPAPSLTRFPISAPRSPRAGPWRARPGRIRHRRDSGGQPDRHDRSARCAFRRNTALHRFLRLHGGGSSTSAKSFLRGVVGGNAQVSQSPTTSRRTPPTRTGPPPIHQRTERRAYIVTSLNTNLGATSASFPLRLIIHNDGVNVNLLQHVFYGSDVNSNTIVSTARGA